MNFLSEWLQSTLGINTSIQLKLLTTVLIIGVLAILRKALLRLLHNSNRNLKSQYQWKNAISYLIWGLGIIVFCGIWFESGDSLATYLGLLSAGLAIALQVPITNIAGWIFIMFRRPFEIGDRIEIAGLKGDVIDIRIFQFTINEIGSWVDADQSTGRIIHVPNGTVFNQPVTNFDRGFSYVWHEIPVMVTFESNWKKAKEILHKIIIDLELDVSKKASKELRKAEKKYFILYNKLTPIIYTDVKDSGINLTLRFLCGPRRRRGTQQKVWEAILTEFDKTNDIDLAYPTIRYFNNLSEGKHPE